MSTPDAASAGYAGTFKVGTGTPVTIGKAIDVDIKMSAGKLDISTRSGAGWKSYVQGLKEWSASVSHLFLGDDTGFQALQTAYLTGGTIVCSFLDASGYGFTGNGNGGVIGNSECFYGGANNNPLHRHSHRPCSQ